MLRNFNMVCILSDVNNIDPNLTFRSSRTPSVCQYKHQSLVLLDLETFSVGQHNTFCCNHLVVSTLRCGRNNPGSNPGHGITFLES